MKKIELPDELISVATNSRNPHGILNPKAEKCILEGIDEIQCLSIYPWTAIKLHGHDDQWEVWLNLSKKVAYICPKEEQHTFVNESNKLIILMTIKGHSNYSFEELKKFFYNFGFEASLIGAIVQC